MNAIIIIAGLALFYIGMAMWLGEYEDFMATERERYAAWLEAEAKP